MDDQRYQKSSLNTVNRYRNRGKYDYATIHSIVDSTPVLHVSFGVDFANREDAYPVILPMLGCTGSFSGTSTEAKAEGNHTLYLHGYVSSRIMKLSQNGKDGTSSDGIPICVAATLFDGLVLALTPNHHSCNYRSAVVFGRAHLVTDEPERLYAMELITNNLVPERWQNTRYPNDVELKSTGILRVEIDSASAKVRSGTTGEDRNDLKDDAMKKNVWAGVIPAYMQWGKPTPAKTNVVNPVPDYIEDWRKDMNVKSEEYAYSVAK